MSEKNETTNVARKAAGLGISLDSWAVALALGALFSAAYYLRIERSFRFAYGLLYAVYSVLLLQWILPWALITVRDERWGTR